MKRKKKNKIVPAALGASCKRGMLKHRMHAQKEITLRNKCLDPNENPRSCNVLTNVFVFTTNSVRKKGARAL